MILKQIGEGAFSYVYLVRETSSGRRYAMKRVIAQTAESLEAAKREINVHQRVQHVNLLRLHGHAIESNLKGRGHVVSFLFPLYERGSLEDALSVHRPDGPYFREREIVRLLHQICDGVRALHRHKSISWAHCDIKPGNVLVDITRGGTRPILMDFGSVSVARRVPKTKAEASTIREWAEENCSMPYRAPELFDVKVNVAITESVDVWSLGCTTYALAFGYSPFECSFPEGSDGRTARVEKCSHLRVLNGVKFPDKSKFSKSFCDLIASCVRTDPSTRPTVDDLFARYVLMS